MSNTCVELYFLLYGMFGTLFGIGIYGTSVHFNAYTLIQLKLVLHDTSFQYEIHNICVYRSNEVDS